MESKIFSLQFVRKYKGKYIAVIDNKIVASAKTAKEVFELAKKTSGGRRKVSGIFYIPTRQELLTALINF